mmetsp:Transcript_53154/g.99655  ORF Transcript_53154/g.99655 Transcript_53154/m.99655 type:complete len:207 (+) Transcript_53154:160-780(+)
MMRSDFLTVVAGVALRFQDRMMPGCRSRMLTSVSLARITKPSSSFSALLRAMRSTRGRSKVRLTDVARVINSAMNSVLLPAFPSMRSSRCFGLTVRFGMLFAFQSFKRPSGIDFTRHTFSSALSRRTPARASLVQFSRTSKICASSTSCHVSRDSMDSGIDRFDKRADPCAETSSARHSDASSTIPVWQQVPMALGSDLPPARWTS